MALAGAGVAEQHDGFAGVHVGAGGEVARVAGAMVGTASTLKSASRLRRGNLASLMRRARRRSAAVVDLGGEDLGEVAEVGASFPDGDLGQSGGFGADGGQVQFAGGGADGGLRGGVDGR